MDKEEQEKTMALAAARILAGAADLAVVAATCCASLAMILPEIGGGLRTIAQGLRDDSL